MKLLSIDIEDTRNIARAHLEPDGALTVLCGSNGQGKTNLLECVWLLTGSRSFRGARDDELVREGCESGCVEGVTEGRGRENTVRIFIGGAPGARRARSAKVNGVPHGRASNIAGLFTAVLFQPDHLSLVKGPADGRRRFLDAALCQLYPSYVELLRAYTRTLTQRNALLKQCAKGQGDPSLLDVFDERLAQAGADISARRAQYTDMVLPEAQRTYRDITSGAEDMTCRYIPCCEGGSSLLSQLRKARPADLRAGFTTVGPHREELEIHVNGHEARRRASQGQQRSAVLSLKLAEAFGSYQTLGVRPVMLLDDVLSELDEKRQAYLLGRITEHQTIVTSCGADRFTELSGRIYRVDAGTVTEL